MLRDLSPLSDGGEFPLKPEHREWRPSWNEIPPDQAFCHACRAPRQKDGTIHHRKGCRIAEGK